jgi:hypothetical protein
LQPGYVIADLLAIESSPFLMPAERTFKRSFAEYLCAPQDKVLTQKRLDATNNLWISEQA